MFSQGGEALTNGHTGSEVENFDIDGNGQVTIQYKLMNKRMFMTDCEIMIITMGYVSRSP